MAEKAKRKIRIKWVRSTIGFTYRQKEMVRSLGLRRLNQIVERSDTPQIRGLVANIPHFVEIVSATPASPWALVPEYTIGPPEVLPAPPAAAVEAKVTQEEPVGEVEEAPVASQASAGSPALEAAQPAKVVNAEKPARRPAPEKGKAPKVGASKKKKQEKTAKGKMAKPGKKGRK